MTAAGIILGSQCGGISELILPGESEKKGGRGERKEKRRERKEKGREEREKRKGREGGRVMKALLGIRI